MSLYDYKPAPQYSFPQRLRLAFLWNARWSTMKAEGRDALVDVIDGGGNAVLFAWALVRLLTLPVGVFVISPIFTAACGRSAGWMKTWRAIDLTLSNRGDDA